MALIIQGKSQCQLCQKTLEEGQEIKLFPALTTNMKDDFYIFSDVGVHQKCFDEHPLKEKVDTFLENMSEKFNSKICDIGKTKIEHYDDFYGIGLLTSNENEPLLAYNCLVFDRKNLKFWTKKEHFIKLAKEFLAQEKWEGFMGQCVLKTMIDELEKL